METDPTEPSETDIDQAISLLQEVPSWDGRMAVIPVDPLCFWEDGGTVCGEHLEEACVLLQEEDGSFCAHVLVLCTYHAKCMEAGLAKWRTLA